MARLEAHIRRIVLNDLYRYNQYKQEIKKRREEILHSSPSQTIVTTYDEKNREHGEIMPTARGKSDPTQRTVIKLHDPYLKRLEETVEAIERTIRTDKRYSSIMRYCFIERLEDDQVAEIMRKSKTTVSDLRKAFINEVAVELGHVKG